MSRIEKPRGDKSVKSRTTAKVAPKVARKSAQKVTSAVARKTAAKPAARKAAKPPARTPSRSPGEPAPEHAYEHAYEATGELRGNGADPSIARGESAGTVYQELRERIVRGRLPPGSRLVEREVAARLGVSRTPVRAALERLRQEGFIIGTGNAILTRATVAPLTNDDARSIYQIVALIEGLAAHEAAEKPRAVRTSMTRHMRDVNTQFRSAALERMPDPDKLLDLDDAFHNSYVHVGASARLRVLHNAVKPQAERYGRIYTSTLAREVSTSAAEHDVIIKALEAGDAQAAQRAVETNWHNAAKRLARVISSVGERGTW